MKRSTILAAIILLYLTACQESITVFIDKAPGEVAGVIHPADAEATVGLYQEVLIAETTTDNQGGFRLSDVAPGVYTLRVTADGYGTLVLYNITVKDDETNYVGDLILSILPWPMRSAEPAWGDTLESAGVKIVIRFRADVVNATVEDAFTINPEVENQTISVDYVSGGDMLVIDGDFMLGTTYTYSIDTTLNTYIEQSLEFPFTSSFTTVPFTIISASIPSSNHGPVIIEFNSLVSYDQLLQHIVVTPETELELDMHTRIRSRYSSYERVEWEHTRLAIEPSLIWLPGTTVITLSGDLAETGGATLGTDFSYNIVMDSLSVTRTRPYDGQYYVDIDEDIILYFNTLVDESTIEGAVTLSPSHTLNFDTYSGYATRVIVDPDTLFSDTIYTVSVNTSIRDIGGGGMSAPYSFTFGTQ